MFQFNIQRARFVTITSFVACLFAVVSVNAQQASVHQTDQAKVVKAIFEATKTARTETDYTDFLAQCDAAIEQELSKANRDYVISLRGWALNRRAEKRFELATQLKKIGNNRAAETMKSAMDDFDESIIADSQRVRSWMSRGIANVANEKLDAAILDFTEATKLKTDNPKGWFNRAETLYQRGNFEHAISDYSVVLRLNSDDAQALTGRGLSALALKRYEDALKDFELVMEQQPNNHAAFINRGDAFQNLGRWKEAKSDYEKSISLKETGIACQRSAWLLATCPDPKIQDEKAARTLIDRAIAMEGRTSSILDTLAATEAAEGNFNSAKTTQQEVIGLVSAEEDVDSPFAARLMLYEKSEPYVQGDKSEK